MSHPSTEQYREVQYELYQDKISKMSDEELLQEWVSLHPGMLTEYVRQRDWHGRSHIETNLLDAFAVRLYEQSLA